MKIVKYLILGLLLINSLALIAKDMAPLPDLPPLPTGLKNSQQEYDKFKHRQEQKNLIASQIAAERSPKSPIQLPPKTNFGKISDPAFQNMLKKQFPLSPEQIKAFRQALDIQQRALRVEIKNPDPVMSTRVVNLEPGSSPPAVRISSGYVSSILFTDETGAAWPIKAYDIGNPKAFNIYWNKSSNMLLIQGQTPYARTNLIVILEGLKTPIILSVINDQQKVDYRLDLIVPGKGPKAKTQIINSSIPAQPNLVLSNLLYGIAPKKSKKLTVVGGYAQAWLEKEGSLLLRTKLDILSPGWLATMNSVDGTKVYRMNVTPLILATENGRTIQLHIEGL